jgi:hypothetical protein
VSAAPLCDHCKEVIGVYEPLVRVTDGQVHEGSRALEPTSSDGEGQHYHRACFERLDDERRSATRLKDFGGQRASVVSPHSFG